MASEITHVVYGKKIFDRLGDHSWPEFVTGTLFPDIRYMAKIDRKLVHFINTSEDKIPLNNSFRAGMYVHSLVDEKRELFLKSKRMYELLPENRLNATALKLVEDEVVYGRYKNWEGAVLIPDNLFKEEYLFSIPKKTIDSWYKFLQYYFNNGPSELAWNRLIQKLGFDKKLAREVIVQVNIIKQKTKVMNIIKSTYNYI